MDIAELLRMFAALATTLGLIGLAAFAARRWGPAKAFAPLAALNPQARKRMQVVETLLLDPSRRLVLVRVDDRERLILIGEAREIGPPGAGAQAAETSAQETGPS